MHPEVRDRPQNSDGHRQKAKARTSIRAVFNRHHHQRNGVHRSQEHTLLPQVYVPDLLLMIVGGTDSELRLLMAPHPSSRFSDCYSSTASYFCTPWFDT